MRLRHVCACVRVCAWQFTHNVLHLRARGVAEFLKVKKVPIVEYKLPETVEPVIDEVGRG